MQDTINSLWRQRITNAEKVYGDWEQKFRCKVLEDYYEGWHWKGKKDFFSVNYNPYTLNLVYNTIKIKQASLLFQRPSFLATPTPGNSQWDLDFAVRSAQLKQDVLNTIVKNPNTFFTDYLKQVHLDSMFRFGVLEIGYAADWRNPQKDEPELKSWTEEDVPERKDKLVTDNAVPVNERFYIKRIPPRRFRVALSEANELRDHEWCGYFEFYYTRSLKRTEGINWPKGAGDVNYLGADYSGGILADPHVATSNPEYARLLAAGEISKVWHIWDMVSHKRILLLDGHTDDPLWECDCERLPIIDLRWDFRLEGFYPIPPVFQWISPQDEINEAREQTRSYRRRFTRKFQTVKGQIEEEEAEKFVSGPDGVLIEVKVKDAITPIQNPEQGPTAEGALVLAKDDFNVISGATAESRGQMSDRETATQAKLVDSRSQLRESAEQMDFSNFVCKVGRELLCQAQENLSNGLWVQYTANPSDGVLQDMQANGPDFQWIQAQDISDGYDFMLDLDITNATPAAMEQVKQSFMTFLALVQNYPMIALSPVLIREAAYRCGYRNEKVIQQMQQAALVQQQTQMLQKQQGGQQGQPQMGQTGQNPQNAAQTQVAQQMPNTQAQTEQQIKQQLVH
jgi:hypothetical protein